MAAPRSPPEQLSPTTTPRRESWVVRTLKYLRDVLYYMSS